MIKSGAEWSTTGLVGAALAIGGLLIFLAGRALEQHETAGKKGPHEECGSTTCRQVHWQQVIGISTQWCH